MNATITRPTAGLALALAATLTLAGCAANEAGATGTPSGAPGLHGTIAGIGSSAQGTAQQTWIAGIQDAHPGLTVDYDPQGSGAGRKGFIAGAADFAGSDAPLTTDELSATFAACTPGTGALDLPVYISPIAIAFHVAGVTSLTLDADTIAGIFSGAVTRWDAPAIAALNPTAKLPDAPITVIHRSDDSGTTQNFTEYLAAAAPDVWTKEPSQTFPYAVGDAAKGTSGVAAAAKAAAGSITYIDESAAAGLSTATLRVGTQTVSLSAAGAAATVAASATAPGRAAGDIAVDIDRTPTAKDAWPLVLVSYLIVCQDYADDATGALVRGYAEYVAGSEGQEKAAAQAGSAPLAPALADTVLAAARTIR